MSLSTFSLVLGQITFEGTVKDSVNAKVIKQFPALSDTLNKVSMGTQIDVVLSN